MLGFCCVNPDGGDYGQWTQLVHQALDKWRRPFSQRGCLLSLQNHRWLPNEPSCAAPGPVRTGNRKRRRAVWQIRCVKRMLCMQLILTCRAVCGAVASARLCSRPVGLILQACERVMCFCRDYWIQIDVQNVAQGFPLGCVAQSHVSSLITTPACPAKRAIDVLSCLILPCLRLMHGMLPWAQEDSRLSKRLIPVHTQPARAGASRPEALS